MPVPRPRRLVLAAALLLGLPLGATAPAGAVDDVEPDPTTEGYRIVVEPLGRDVAASGLQANHLVARAWTDSGEPVTGLTVTFSSTDPDHVFSSVSRSGNTHRVALTSSLTPGVSTITATSTTGDPTVVGAQVTQVAYVRPRIRPVLTSAHRHVDGWYRGAVTVGWSCTGSRVVAWRSCPAPVRVAHETRYEPLTASFQDGEGVWARTWTHVAVDTTGPRIVVRGLRNGHTYQHVSPRHRDIRARDDGIGVEHVYRSVRFRREITRLRHRYLVRWTASASDRLGNTTRTSGRYYARHR